MKDRIEELAEQFGLLRNAYVAIRNEALELAARECDQMSDKLYPHAQAPYKDCAAAIRKMRVE
jgi:hypothetical protein